MKKKKVKKIPSKLMEGNWTPKLKKKSWKWLIKSISFPSLTFFFMLKNIFLSMPLVRKLEKKTEIYCISCMIRLITLSLSLMNLSSHILKGCWLIELRNLWQRRCKRGWGWVTRKGARNSYKNWVIWFKTRCLISSRSCLICRKKQTSSM